MSIPAPVRSPKVCASRGSRRPLRWWLRSPRPLGRRSAIIGEFNAEIALLEAELTDHFEQHPDAEIYLSQPGIGVVLGARVLGEFGDDPNRYADAKSRKNYAGTSPITKASGRTHVVAARYVRNRRLADAVAPVGVLRAGATASAPAPSMTGTATPATPTTRRCERSANRLVGILHGCLRTHTLYDDHTAWAHRPENDLTTEIRPAA